MTELESAVHDTANAGGREAREEGMQVKRKTMIVTGASQGIGAGVTKAFLKRGYDVVANSRRISESEFTLTDRLVLVDGNIGEASTAAKIAATAMSTFASIDGVVNNAGIFFSKRFTDYTVRDFELLSETNLQGYIYITQLAVKQMLAQKTGGSITGITTAMVEHPIAGVNASVPMITKGGLEAITRSLAMEYGRRRHRRGNRLSDGSSSCNRGGAARGRRCAQRKMVNSAENRLAAAGIELPPAPPPFGPYVPAVQTGNLLFLTGMLPSVGHEPKFLGRAGKELIAEQVRSAAFAAALNVLAVARQHLGSLDRISRVVRLGVYIATAEDFSDHVTVADAASELLRDILGKDKMSTRLVFGVESLPLGVPVELEAICEVSA